ncbi:MAG: 16S rRNA (cytosine(1402)-N(4))-methyltransferase RsmH [Rhodospirillales bacterium]|nr:16S rRNA (cytosine(1402)-N(4))-methyltransferase RsmH [Alphaproteobacteria bacterium]MCB9986979.1 16S rRNA (cytosine(1402)-N(4))-methyltransferase RsmH [Rhodospirillales bacterium]USO08247.1 MAG: 16S rRNA (cytosine(1402)-N(4))-methyltransferase RsmH [Rhodospirillales bacterium]
MGASRGANRGTNAPHVPVMLDEVLAALAPRAGAVYVDGTFGAGGYTRAILDKADCQVIAIDRDESAIARARGIDRLMPVHGAFGDVAAHLAALGQGAVDGFVLDIGVSSMQIDDPARGFSFAKDGPLDMRMDRSQGESASMVVNTWPEQALADIIWRYGEERHARRIAAAIIRARAEKRIETTLVLADLIAGAVPGGGKKYAIHPATRTFQALRIAVNGELEQLERALEASIEILKPGGRLVIVTFHSLEDGIVKSFLRAHGPTQGGSRHRPETASVPALFTQPVRRALAPGDAETARNPRARSAKLRWAVRSDAQNERSAA